MDIEEGDVVDFKVFKLALYACWGTARDKIGYSHAADWTEERPVPQSAMPKIGEILKVRVFKLVTEPQADLPLEVTHGRTIHVDFAGTRAMVDEAKWLDYLERAKA